MTSHNLPGPLVVLDIGGTKIAGAIALPSTNGDAPDIILEQSRPTNPSEGGEAVLATVIALATELVAHFRQDNDDDVVGVGIASAGVVDEDSGAITSATDLIPGWAGTELGARVSEALGLPTRVLNDVHAHALGEVTWGAAREASSAVVLGVGTGIGGAVVLHGRVLRGAHSIAGHLGHIHHSLGRGFLCSCGRDGHIEPVASGSGVATLYHRRLKDTTEGPAAPGTLEPGTTSYSGLDVQNAAEAGDTVALSAIEDSARALGEIMGSLANAIDPDVFVLSGSMTKTGPMWWEPLRDGFAASAMTPLAGTPILNGTLGGRAPLLGAAANFALTCGE
ncbi:ROK family protein [Arcanobacterium haemolyticum]|nr:ROK family protein [Arcanobacterium haemolyticum]